MLYIIYINTIYNYILDKNAIYIYFVSIYYISIIHVIYIKNIYIIPSHTYSFSIIYTGSQPLLLCQKPRVAASFTGISPYSGARNYRLPAGECRTHAYCIYLQNKYIKIYLLTYLLHGAKPFLRS